MSAKENNAARKLPLNSYVMVSETLAILTRPATRKAESSEQAHDIVRNGIRRYNVPVPLVRSLVLSH